MTCCWKAVVVSSTHGRWSVVGRRGRECQSIWLQKWQRDVTDQEMIRNEKKWVWTTFQWAWPCLERTRKTPSLAFFQGIILFLLGSTTNVNHLDNCLAPSSGEPKGKHKNWGGYSRCFARYSRWGVHASAHVHIVQYGQFGYHSIFVGHLKNQTLHFSQITQLFPLSSRFLARFSPLEKCVRPWYLVPFRNRVGKGWRLRRNPLQPAGRPRHPRSKDMGDMGYNDYNISLWWLWCDTNNI